MLKEIDPQEFLTVVRTLYGEARGEPHEGKHAVMWVILNRAREGTKYGGPTLEGVCRKKWQFSCWNEGDPMRAKLLTASINKLANCVRAALEVLEGKIADPTGGANHYLNPEVTRKIQPSGQLPSWAREDAITAKIGLHWFYKL